MINYLHDITEAIRGTNWAQIDALGRALKDVRALGRTAFVCGNGGSHAVALHWGVDLVKVAHVNVYTLGTNMSLASALSNDLDYSVALSTEMVTRANPEDVVIALSCSGTSSNIKSVLHEARKLHIESYLLTGMKAPEYDRVRHIRVASVHYDILEDVFSAIGHYLTRELST